LTHNWRVAHISIYLKSWVPQVWIFRPGSDECRKLYIPCLRIGLPIREYLAAVLPGLGNRSIQSLDQLTPAAYAANKAK
jgi:hypothetical protein